MLSHGHCLSSEQVEWLRILKTRWYQCRWHQTSAQSHHTQFRRWNNWTTIRRNASGNEIFLNCYHEMLKKKSHCTYIATFGCVSTSLLQWKSNKHYIFCVRACMSVPWCVGMCMRCARVALLIQHARRTGHTVSSLLAPLAPTHFLTLSHKRHDFRKNVIEDKTFILIFSTNFVFDIPHSKKNLTRYCYKCENVFI
jgi:hypothetical protein